MTKKIYPPEFKKEAASLVLDQGYTRKAACEAMWVGTTALDRWIRQLREEREGKTPEKSAAITDPQHEIQALKAQVRQLEREKEILKKATALLVSDTLSKWNWSTSWARTIRNERLLKPLGSPEALTTPIRASE